MAEKLWMRTRKCYFLKNIHYLMTFFVLQNQSVTNNNIKTKCSPFTFTQASKRLITELMVRYDLNDGQCEMGLGKKISSWKITTHMNYLPI